MPTTDTRVHLRALGCRLNEAELAAWSRDFRARGWRVVDDPEQADLVVVNTCAVTDEAARKSRQLVRRSQRRNPAAKLVVSGCYATLDRDRAAADLGVDLLVPNPDKDRLVTLALDALALPVQPALAIEPDAGPHTGNGRQRAFVKVQDGCRYRCSYCAVTLARGAETSRPVSEVVAEIDALHGRGVQEVVLAGVHLGGYGADHGTHLAELVDAVLQGTAIPRLRLGSLEPWDLPPGFWGRFADPRLLPHLHLPMQSGADSVLRRMARRCRRDEFLALAAAGRAAVPGLNITTDIIVGFPGETDAEWQQTLDFVAAAGFGDVHIFAYSPRTGTKAATLPDPVGRDVVRARSEQLHALVARQRRDLLERQLGGEFAVLVESGRVDPAGAGFLWSGYTPNYLKVVIPAPPEPDLANRVVRTRVHATVADGSALVGEAV